MKVQTEKWKERMGGSGEMRKRKRWNETEIKEETVGGRRKEERNEERWRGR